MLTKQYSKEKFDIQYPLLMKAENFSFSPSRYYSKPIKIYDSYYFLCSEWFEKEGMNNDRPYLMKWFALQKQ